MSIEHRSDWVDGKVVTDEKTGITVVGRMKRGFQPEFDISVGWTVGERFFPGRVPPAIKVERVAGASIGGVVTVSKDGMTLARLLDEVALWVEGQVQAHVDREVENKARRELADIAKAKGLDDVAKTGKTEREADKRARHEQNQAARRAADQERTSITKGKSK